MYATCFPSGDQDGKESDQLGVSCRACVPSVSITSRPFDVWPTTSVPSGETAAWSNVPVGGVSCVRGPPFSPMAISSGFRFAARLLEKKIRPGAPASSSGACRGSSDRGRRRHCDDPS